MTDKLLQPPLLEKIRNYLGKRRKTKEIFLFVPYIKTKTLSKLVDGLDNITIVTTWHTNDLLSGSSELDLYLFCKEHNYTLYIHNDIHLKVYSVGLDSAIVASGNISHGGLEGGNEECGTFVNELSIQDRLFLEKIKANATFIDEEEYQRHLKLIEEKKEIVPEIEKHPDLIITAKEEHFFKSSLPMTRSVDDLIKGYANMSSGLEASDDEETKACIIHDLGIYNLEQLGLSEDEFVAKLKIQFFSHPFIKKIDEFINPEAYWGRVREWVQQNCKDDPIPRRWELTENTQTLYDWFVKLSDGKFVVDVPGACSERIRRVDGTLEYENAVLEILQTPGHTIDEIREIYKNSDKTLSIHDDSIDPAENNNRDKPVWHFKDEMDDKIINILSLTPDEIGERNSNGKLYKKIAAVMGKLHDTGIIKMWYYKESFGHANSDGVWRLTKTNNNENPISQFQIGQFYHHDEIWKPLNLGWAGGIRASAKNNLVVLFWNAPSQDPQKERDDEFSRVNIYEDHFDEKTGLYHYIGEGQFGNQTLESGSGGNKRIVKAKEKGRTIHLFHQHEIDGKHEYLGEVELVKTTTAKQNDIDGKNRDVLVFLLKPVKKQSTQNTIQKNDSNTNLVLFSAAGDAAFEHFENTILDDVSTKNFLNSKMKEFSNVRMWGANDRSTNQNRSKWSKLKKGDILLFFRDKKYVAKMVLEGTEDNYEIAKMIWGEKIDHKTMNVQSKKGETWQLIMYALPENITKIDLDHSDLNKLVGYKETFLPTRTLDFMPVREELRNNLERKYGSIQKALESIGI